MTLALLLTLVAFLDTNAPPRPLDTAGIDCTCAEVFESYAEQVEAAYLGYRFEVADRDTRFFTQRTVDYRRRAQRTPLRQCVHLIHEWLGLFGDPHIGALRSLSDSTRKARGWPQSMGMQAPDQVRQRLTDRADQLDPVEGIWYAGNRVMAVVESDDLAGLFLAVVLEEDDVLGKAGAVIARLERGIEQGQYRVVGVGPLAGERRASVHADRLLRIGQTRMGRRFPAPVHAPDPLDPFRPTIKQLEAGAVLVSVPSHRYGYKTVLDSLVHLHHEALRDAKDIVIDLRGNSGGSSIMTDALHPYLYSPDMEPSIWDGPSAILTSEITRAYYKARMQWGMPYARAAVLLAKAELGDIIRDPRTQFPERKPDTLYAGSRKVGVLTDWVNISAVDVFLLDIRRSSRVTLFGEATNSAVDHLSVTRHVLDIPTCPQEGFVLYLPTSAAPWMPDGGLNATGIEPDVVLSMPQSEWIDAALTELRSGGSQATE
ncbi:MAG: S41 family peptidase [Bacteroidota bacterium]